MAKSKDKKNIETTGVKLDFRVVETNGNFEMTNYS